MLAIYTMVYLLWLGELKNSDSDILNLKDNNNDDDDVIVVVISRGLSDDQANLEDIADFENLSEEEQMHLLDDTLAVRKTMSKVCVYFHLFNINDNCFAALTAFFCSDSFDHYFPSGMTIILPDL